LSAAAGQEEDDDERVREPAPAPPTRLGRYRLCFELASGGMATVYLGRIEGGAGFEKFVAIKIVHRHLAHEPQFIEMFLDEARLAAAIDHPNVCSVFDFGETDGVYYLAMEYLLGESLLRVSKELAARRDAEKLAQLPWYAARIFADACEGLHAAHELCGPDGKPLGVVHRDVTPQNLVVTYEGSVKVVDFGVAKAASQLHTTEAGKIKGKLAYVSPEQLRNKPLDRRSDVFALGICLWETLTLQRLFRRDSEAATLMAVAYDEIPKPSSVRKWVPPELDAIVMKALERDPAARHASARELGRELSAFLTKSGATVGMADVAEWMKEMFAAERDKRLELLRRAREAREVAPVPEALSEPSSTGSAAPSMSLEISAAIPRPPVAAAPRRGVRAGLALGVVAAFATVAAVLAWTLQPPSFVASPLPPEPSAASEPGSAPGSPAPVTASAPAGSAEIGAGTVSPSAEPVPLAVVPEPVAVPSDPTPEPDPTADRSPGPDPLPATSDSTDDRARHEVVPSAPPRREGGRRPARAERQPEPDRQPEPAPSAGTGRVQIGATGGGWAEVVIDGRRVGRTPQLVTLAVGSHTVELLPFGTEPAHTERVDVERGDLLVLRVRIEGSPEP
jgi:serine/threonine-protein kinase